MAHPDVMSLPAKAKQRYLTAMAIAAILSGALALDVFYIRRQPPSIQQKSFAVIIALLEHGCSPVPEFPQDVFGIRYIRETARHVREHTLLQQRRELIDTLGHTFKHGQFPEAVSTITTDDAENVKAVLSTRCDDWALPAIRVHSFLPILGRHSIFVVNAMEWQHARAIMRPSFVRDQISDFECFDRHIVKLTKRIPMDGTPFDLQALLSMFTTDTISDFMFGHSTDILGSAPEDGLKFGRYFDASMHKIALRARLGWFTLILPDGELNEYAHFLRTYVERYVSDARAKYEGEGESKDEGHKYVFLRELLKSGEPDDVIRDHLMSIFTAGRDTTISVLSYLFLQLSQHPDVVEKIRREIRELGVKDPTWEHLRNLKYLNWTIKEALRLNPPVAMNQREAVRDTVLPRGGGPDGSQPVFVEKGSSCRYQPWVMHRRKDVFGEDAEAFRPERWEDLKLTAPFGRLVLFGMTQPSAVYSIMPSQQLQKFLVIFDPLTLSRVLDRFEYVPFNAGPRICIGQQFANTQMALFTLRFLQAFKKIERRDERPVIQKVGVNTTLLNGCWISVTPG
ncbi:cytochrome P450 [Xylariomycetidae sp. FL2044]|nr:cytochrome P450 [Xylariomycetidae sp. FL2044]